MRDTGARQTKPCCSAPIVPPRDFKFKFSMTDPSAPFGVFVVVPETPVVSHEFATSPVLPEAM